MISPCTGHTQTGFGRWMEGYNGGGQVSCSTFYKNPEIEFEVYEDDSTFFVDTSF